MPSQIYVSFLQIGVKRNQMETVVTGAPSQIRTDNLAPVRDGPFMDVSIGRSSPTTRTQLRSRPGKARVTIALPAESELRSTLGKET